MGKTQDGPAAAALQLQLKVFKQFSFPPFARSAKGGAPGYTVDWYGLIAVGVVVLVVLNGMFFAVRATEPDLPKAKLRRLNKFVVWPIFVLAVLVVIVELFSGR